MGAAIPGGLIQRVPLEAWRERIETLELEETQEEPEDTFYNIGHRVWVSLPIPDDDTDNGVEWRTCRRVAQVIEDALRAEWPELDPGDVEVEFTDSFPV